MTLPAERSNAIAELKPWLSMGEALSLLSRS